MTEFERTNFAKMELQKEELMADPFMQFSQWLQVAEDDSEVHDATACNLSTVSETLRPNGRIVYLRDVTDNGYVIYTNYLSQKGKDLRNNPFGCLTFFWMKLERQVRITGRMDKVSIEMSDAYFAGRPRESQLGAWASEQSSSIDGRETLEERLKYYEEKFLGLDVPRPENWGGYELVPDTFEFWQGRPHRLHDRFRYEKSGDLWKLDRLAP